MGDIIIVPFSLYAVFAVIVGVVAFGVCLVGGVAELASVLLRRPGGRRVPSAPAGAVKVAAAAVLAVVPWLSEHLAEAATGWVDEDHDGMLDPFVNGAYDWVDVNLWAWLRSAAVLVTIVLAATAMLLRRVRQLPGDGSSRRPGALSLT